MSTALAERTITTNEQQVQRPRVVELVGPAGSGKTTLYQALSGCTKVMQPANFPDVHRVSAAPFFIWNGLQLLLRLSKVSRHNSRRLSRREFAWLSILNGWPQVLRRATRNDAIILLDQGPVYLLTETREFGPGYLGRPEAEELWRYFYSRWAGSLDMIVWLDAADIDLTQRIRSRSKEHIVKNQSDEITFGLLDRYRGAYEQTISGLSAKHPNLRILRFDTAQKSPEEIVRQLLFELGLA